MQPVVEKIEARPVIIGGITAGSRRPVTDPMKQLKIRIARNIWGNIYGYCGRRRIKSFGMDSFDAKLWVESCQRKGHQVTVSGLW